MPSVLHCLHALLCPPLPCPTPTPRACAGVVESSQFEDFEEFMTAVQALWDSEWERVHAAPRKGALTAPAPACRLAGCCTHATVGNACVPAWLGQLGGR
jgi:hypothetical protein